VIPVTITHKHETGPDSIITGERLLYSQTARIADWEGAGRAQFPDPKDVNTTLVATWQTDCIVHLLDAAGGQMQIQDADLGGNVVVDHPKFHLTSSQLDLLFEPAPAAANEAGANGAIASGAAANPAGADASSSTEIKQITAYGDGTEAGRAHCVVHETGSADRSIQSQQLRLFTAHADDGSIFAKTVLADGSVLANDPDQSLTSEHLDAELEPIAPAAAANPPANAVGGNLPVANQANANQVANADPPAGANTNANQAAGNPGENVQLKSLVATENVHFKGKDGGAATGDVLTVTTVGDNQQEIKIDGKPLAAASSKDSTITGPTIRSSSLTQISNVDGAGTMHSVQQPQDATQPARPIDVAWTQGAVVDSPHNEIRILGDVDVNSRDPNGTVDLAHSGRLLMTLEPKPVTQPAAETGDDKPDVVAATRPAGASAASFDFMQNKEVRAISLLDKAHVQTSLHDTDADKTLLRRFDMLGEEIDYDVITKQVTIPVPGVMLMYEHQPANAPAANAPAANKPASNKPASNKPGANKPGANKPGANNPANSTDAGGSSGGSGVTRFQWENRFDYDDAKGKATFTGNVQIIHKSDVSNTQQTMLQHAATVVANFITAPAAAGGDKKSPATQPSDPTARMQLHDVTADGPMDVINGATSIHCGHIDYSPSTQILICKAGTEGVVTVSDDQHRGGATFSEVWFNTQTNTIDRMFNLTAHTR
jgi:hypothetical protein